MNPAGHTHTNTHIHALGRSIAKLQESNQPRERERGMRVSEREQGAVCGRGKKGGYGEEREREEGGR